MFAQYRQEYPEQAELWDKMMAKAVPSNIEDKIIANIDCEKPTATRSASGMVIQEAAKLVPSLWGGSADLAPSTKTDIKGAGDFEKDNPLGWNIHFGVREHGMGAEVNGIALYGGFIPYGATFLIFSDYMRPPIRLAALMKLHVIHVFTHDSIFLGEDGPTHRAHRAARFAEDDPEREGDSARGHGRDGGRVGGRAREHVRPHPARSDKAESAGLQRRPDEGQGPAQRSLRRARHR